MGACKNVPQGGGKGLNNPSPPPSPPLRNYQKIVFLLCHMQLNSKQLCIEFREKKARTSSMQYRFQKKAGSFKNRTCLWSGELQGHPKKNLFSLFSKLAKYD